MVNVRDLDSFKTFLRMCAGRIGQLVNLSGLASDCGITHNTAKAWLSILQASYICFTLLPHHRNFSKRLIKSPKLYFLDSSLVASLTRQPGADAALAGAAGGALFEGWVLSETLKAHAAIGKPPDVHFWRSHDRLEIDLILSLRGRLQPIEVKLTATPTARHVLPIEKLIETAAVQGPADLVIDAQTPVRDGPARLRRLA